MYEATVAVVTVTIIYTMARVYLHDRWMRKQVERRLRYIKEGK